MVKEAATGDDEEWLWLSCGLSAQKRWNPCSLGLKHF
jgi:hypothetical protein